MQVPYSARRSLTARRVQTAAASAERLELRDGEVPGLELSVGRRGAKTFRLRYRRIADNRKFAITLGRFDKDAPDLSPDTKPGTRTRLTLKGARGLAKLVLGQVALGADPANGVRERKTSVTFRELADDWHERHSKVNKSAKSSRDDRSMLDRHILPAIGAMKAASIEKRDIIRLLDTVMAELDARHKLHKLKPGSDAKPPRGLTHRPNRVFEIVRAICRWGVSRDLLKREPTWRMKAPIKKEKPRDRELSPAEIRQLWSALDRAPVEKRVNKEIPRGQRVLADDDMALTKSTALTIKLALATAQRIGEVTGIAMSELNLDSATPVWTIPGSRSKNGQASRVPLSPIAVRLIKEARALSPESEWLFPNPKNSGPMDRQGSTKGLERSRPAIGLPHFRIHDLRRTAATRMAELGVSPHTISLVLNHISAHKGTITMKVYVQYSYDKEKREALELWGRRLEEIVAGKPGDTEGQRGTVGSVSP